MHGQFLRETANTVSNSSQWTWLRKRIFTKKIEGLICAAQEQALSTNAIKAHIYNLPCSPKCRLCGIADETVDHLVSSCSYLVQREYKGRHDAIASLIHWTLLKQAGCQVCSLWRRHTPTTVWENDGYKVLWDFTIVTYSAFRHNRPDIVLMRRTSNEILFMIDVAIPGESRISQKTV